MNDDPRIDGPGRRGQPRKPVTKKFILNHYSFGKVSCYSRDLSLSGTFLTGKFEKVYPGDTVELEFEVGMGASDTHRFSASVVRVESDGIALKFLSLGMDTYGALLDLTLSA